MDKKPTRPKPPKFVATEEQQSQVAMMAACGIKHESIAKIIGCAYSTLRKHFKSELALGLDNANANVGGVLYQQAMAAQPWAVCFWLKTRGGYRETNRTELANPDGSAINYAPVYAVTFPDEGAAGEDVGAVEVSARSPT
jgi:hypothetical protein